MSGEDKKQTTEEPTCKTSVAFKLLGYRRELARKKPRHLKMMKSKLELTQDLESNNFSKPSGYKNDPDLKRSISDVICKQKIKYDVAKYSIVLKKAKKLDEKAMLKHLQERDFLVKKMESKGKFRVARRLVF